MGKMYITTLLQLAAKTPVSKTPNLLRWSVKSVKLRKFGIAIVINFSGLVLSDWLTAG
jgi:hypothetical protein